MRILLVASGAREHAIADALSRSPQKPEIIAVCTTKNPGLKKLSQELHVGNILDFPWVMEIAKKSKPALAIVGPDDPIGNGLADLLEAAGIATIEEGMAYAKECIEEGGRVVVEEKLVGVEFSLLSFVSGTQVVDMPAIQDHKRAFTGDTGPNTGGMGTYTDSDHSLPFLTAEDLNRAKEINRLTAQSLLKECGEPYRGILYGGFIAVKDGIRVIEFNARFGDPEALNVLPLLSSDLVAICQAITMGELTEDLVKFEKKATVCKYIAPQSYPVSKDQKGMTVAFPKIPTNARLYFGDISEDKKGTLHLGGSRTAGIVGIGDSIAEAEMIAEKLCEA